MSKGIRMALVMNLLYLLFSGILVHSDQSTVPLRSFKIGENATYDCIDIYKQPGLDHPFLKNHTIQMKPSTLRTEIKSHIGINKTCKKKVECPDGTVPVLRNTKEIITNNAQIFAEKNFHPLSADSPGTHIAGVRSRPGPYRGVESWFTGYNLNIAKDQAAYSQIYIGSGSNKEDNFISAGWMINPSFFPDGRLWTYGFWKGKDGKQCYNTACSGFVQVSKVLPIVQPIDDLPPGKADWLHYSIHQDKNTRNWWLTQVGSSDVPTIDIGYWPKELFNLLDNGANMVGVGGVVQASRSGLSPQMGNGQFPNVYHPSHSSIFANIEVLNSNYERSKMISFPTEELLDSPNCYKLEIGRKFIFMPNKLGYYFNYGGPGGNSCGV